MTKALLSIITPCYNEAKNLPNLYLALIKILASVDVDWQWIIVDDHSQDASFAVASSLAEQDNRIKVLRFSRNQGSHLAIQCGLRHAQGDCALMLAGDMQDSPGVVQEMLVRWRQGAPIVWAVQNNKKSKSSKIYYWLVRHFTKMQSMPHAGVEFFLIDQKIIKILRQFEVRNNSIFLLIAWLGFQQEYVVIEKQPRGHGRSGWTLSKKIKLLVDTIVSYSYAPIRFFSAAGFLIAGTGFLYALLVLVRALQGSAPVQGWSSLIIIVLVLGGLQMMMLGVLGEYLWRTLDSSRARPSYLIEKSVGVEDDDG